MSVFLFITAILLLAGIGTLTIWWFIECSLERKWLSPVKMFWNAACWMWGGDKIE